MGVAQSLHSDFSGIFSVFSYPKLAKHHHRCNCFRVGHELEDPIHGESGLTYDKAPCPDHILSRDFPE